MATSPDSLETSIRQPSYRVRLCTRGTARRLEYAFLAAAPKDRWWEEYEAVASGERPCLLVRSNGPSWQAYLGGIPSKRRDSVGTLIVYTLVLEGECISPDVPGETSSVPARLVSAWIEDLAEGVDASRGLAGALDSRFEAHEIDGWLADPAAVDDGLAQQVSLRVEQALAQLAGRPLLPLVKDDVRGSERWMAGLRVDGPRAAFHARVRELLQGEVGEAHIVNQVTGPDDVVGLTDGPLAVLVEGSAIGNAQMALVTLPTRSVEELQPASSNGRTDPKGLVLLLRTRWVRVVVIGLAVLAVGVVIWVRNLRGLLR